MAGFFDRFSRLKSENDTGFSNTASGRFLNSNGYPNVKMAGLNPLEKYSWYHVMINLNSFLFILLLIVSYIVINIFFAFIYYLIGIDHLTGIDKSNVINEFTDVFFFSSQTFTTVGYGRIAPVGFLASLVATFEAFLGLLSFAIATGLFYGRFSRPRAFLKFSQNALISPYQDGKALMFRLAPFKNNLLTDAVVILNVAISNKEADSQTEFFTIEAEINKINSLVLNWTIVHKIDENSPFFGNTQEIFQTAEVEIFVQIRAFDEGFASTVVQRTSYTSEEIIFDAAFLPMFKPSYNHETTILNLDKINDFKKVNLN
ncbi:ion channel [Frigoriflavimonas asaccharolytica]|uniref:Inward rectifier potassium channel n=1 Tax=Frigoriflavimonas asaccharolytica TaxID=2735899 RepID=A0A8J8K3Z0_9FLAO|nr:ion channel [Frigoriflavimonas asaccharolytica]NRS91155.1 inward rectifier potassium channel [Frigoriflavimonas asaccharolytica]